MNRIKTIFMLLFMTAGFSSFAQSVVTSAESQIAITSATTRGELAQLSRDLKAQEIVFKYWPKFDNQQKLASISFDISANDGAMTASGEHKTLQNADSVLRIRLNKATNAVEIQAIGDTSNH
jgi:hypothetical protein